jgi:signal transduction histidine kinase
MRGEIQQANQALVESERLATIGRMASSVSHDLRHYLAAIYANSEFLASHRLSEAERAEIFADIRTAVHGTTEMIESLLIFSRTGSNLRRSHELMATLVERAVTLVRAHPDAEGITISSICCAPEATPVIADGKQVERAICNLLLNACQATRSNGIRPEITVDVRTQAGQVIISITDNGEGVPESISTSLFDPFVSEGKQKGTGLGLTLSSCIAAEHGGEVTLLRSRPGETIFRLRLPLEIQPGDEAHSSQTESRKTVTRQ